MDREKFDIPPKCAGCPRLRAWDLRLDSINDDIQNASEVTAKVFATSDIERYMAEVDAEEGYHLHKYEIAKKVVTYFIAHCEGFTTRKDVVDVSSSEEQVDPLVVDISVCGIPEVEWRELNHVLLYLPLEGEDE